MKRKLKKILYILCSRVMVTALLIILQIVWIISAFSFLANYSAVINAGFYILSLVMVLHIISKEEQAAYKTGWIMLILVFPLFGGIFYLIFGDKKPAKRLRNKMNVQHERMMKLLPDSNMALPSTDENSTQRKRISDTAEYLRGVSGYPLYGAGKNDCKYYPFGEDIFVDLVAEMEKAERFIFMEYFIIDEGYMWDSVFDVMKRKAKQGVDVRLLYDDMGSLFLLPLDFSAKLEREGIKCVPFNRVVPLVSLVMNNRDHRKITVIDGKTAFTGGFNLADEYINRINPYGRWKDSGIMVKGNAVRSFTEMFLETWNACRNEDTDEQIAGFMTASYTGNTENTCFLQPYGDTPLDNEAVGENTYIEIINQAVEYVYIFTPYLICSNEMKLALHLAAKRGVDVRIVTPGIPDKKLVFRLTRANYRSLLEYGVRIYEYTPGFIHAKSFVCDGKIAVVGTINLDYRSLFLHFECGALIIDAPCIADIKNDAYDTFKVCNEINKGSIKRTLFGKLLDAVLNIFAPLL